MMFGRVDEVDGSYVATRFLAGAVPAGCLYITDKGPRASAAGPGVQLRMSWRSVGIGYGRVWAPIAAAALLVGGAVRGHLPLWHVLLGLALFALTAVAHLSGRLSSVEKAQLRLLGSVTGLRVDPAMLRPATREAKRTSLQALMVKAGIPLTAEAIASLLDDIPVPALPLVYGYARYAGDDGPWQACAQLVFRRHEEATF